MTAGTRLSVELPRPDGTVLRGYHWKTVAARASIFYIHGIQSHSGWLEDTAAHLNSLSVDVFAMDRRGCGRSEGARGHAASAKEIVDDYSAALRLARSTASGRVVTVVGQSFGGSVLAALAARGEVPDEHLLFCAPALGQQRARLGLAGSAVARGLRGITLTPLRLDDVDYTTDPAALRFMSGDPLMIRSVTDSMRAAMVELEDSYVGGTAWPVRSPVDLALPMSDRIIRLDEAEMVLRAAVPLIETRRFNTTEHYVEWGPARSVYCDWVAERAIRHAS